MNTQSPSNNDTGNGQPAASPTILLTPQLADPAPPVPQARGESDRAFEAFCIYLELGPKRRYAAVARKVGTGYRTVKRWATDFDWRARVKACSAHTAQRFLEAEAEASLDATHRDRSLRDSQYALAEALLLAAQRWLERADDDDLDVLNFSDACRALQVASRLGQRDATPKAGDASPPENNLRDELNTLLDRVFPDPQPDATPTP